jgi:hypothetical protein
MRAALFALLLVVPAVPAGADVIYLVNGSRLIVDRWYEADDDSLELVIARGRVRIAKDEVTRIEEGVRPDDAVGAAALAADAVGVVSPPAAPPPLLDREEAWQRMRALLTQGRALFDDTFLSPAQKLRALRWLEERWRQFAVPAAFHRAYGLGQRALRLTADAFTAQAEGADEARARLREAADQVASADREIRDAGKAGEVDP